MVSQLAVELLVVIRMGIVVGVVVVKQKLSDCVKGYWGGRW